MDLTQLLDGFQDVATPTVLIWALVGALVGTAVGVLPGLGPTSAMSMLFPITTQLSPLAGITMLAGIYYGSQYGGSTTAILLNVPGEVSSTVTAIEGYPLAREGRGGEALAVAAISSFVAGVLGLIGLTLFAPELARAAFHFGAPEYAMLMVFAFTIVANLSGPSLVKGMISAVLGLLIGTIGVDALTGRERFTFGHDDLYSGFDFVAITIGLFAISEVLINAEKGLKRIAAERVDSLYPDRRTVLHTLPATLRSTAIGFFGGILPGVSPAVTSFLSYDVERRINRKGEPTRLARLRRLAGPEGANNATSSSGFVPLLVFGIPSSAPLAVLLGAFTVYGLQPGPELFRDQGVLVYSIIGAMFAGNLMLLVLNLPLVRLWVGLVKIPYTILGPCIVVFSVIGAFSVRSNMFDVWTALGFGVIGYAMKKLEIPAVPMILALILGKSLETLVRRSLVISDGALDVFVRGPITITLLVMAVVSIGLAVWQRYRWQASVPDGVDES